MTTTMADFDNSFGNSNDHDMLRSKFGKGMEEFDAFLSGIVPETTDGHAHVAFNLLEGLVESDCYLSDPESEGLSEKKRRLNEQLTD